MTPEQFFHRYANLPLDDRSKAVTEAIGTSPLTMGDIYFKIKNISDLIRPHEEERRKLLALADNGFRQLEDK